ncbi:MAG: GNAT family N-acetyltransferase [Pseudomonadota bacterium]
MSITVFELSVSDFERSGDQWEALADRSDSPHLFKSWHWCHAWWCSISAQDRDEIELRILVAARDDSTWIGIAPLFQQRVKRAGLTITLLQFLAGGYGRQTIFRAEYNDFLLDRDCAAQAEAALIDAVCALRGWDELAICDITRNSLADAFAERLRTAPRLLADEIGYRVDTSIPFDQYLVFLRGSARRQLFNKRKRLANQGDVDFAFVDSDQWPRFWDTLEQFHRDRWNYRLGPTKRQFIERLCASTAAHAPRNTASRLTLGEQTLSALLDIDYRGRRYNLQAGFDKDAPKGISPSLLHFGYAIEDACETPVSSYEFLVGKGRTENYKAPIATESTTAKSFGFPRLFWLRTLYAMSDLVRRLTNR